MSTFPTLETERLLLRRLKMADAPTVYEYMQEREIAYNTLFIPYPYPLKAAKTWIDRTYVNAQRGGPLTFAVTRKADDLFLGAVDIEAHHVHKNADLGYWLGKPHWGQGYMSEAVRRMIQFGFDDLGMNRIYATYFVRNPASRRVMEKAGMTYEATYRQHVLKWDEYLDIGVCAVLRSDWDSRLP